MRRVETDKGGFVRSRLVVQEIAYGNPLDDFFAGTPGMEVMRYLLHKLAMNSKLKLLLGDVSVAFLHADADEPMYLRLPPDFARPVYCWLTREAIYGRRKAPQYWQDHFAKGAAKLGFARSYINACFYWSQADDLYMLVHGDDIMLVGDEEDLKI